MIDFSWVRAVCTLTDNSSALWLTLPILHNRCSSRASAWVMLKIAFSDSGDGATRLCPASTQTMVRTRAMRPGASDLRTGMHSRVTASRCDDSSWVRRPPASVLTRLTPSFRAGSVNLRLPSSSRVTAPSRSPCRAAGLHSRHCIRSSSMSIGQGIWLYMVLRMWVRSSRACI